MIINNLVGIIADDLTGANDTALQFKKCNAKTKILLDYSSSPESDSSSEVWAISSESRNISGIEAKTRIIETIENLDKNLNLEYFFKKIDSTLRGNIAIETLSMIDLLGYDASVIITALPTEKRITVGGYHIVKGIPISKTEAARDPHSPITESYIPALFEESLDDSQKNLVGLIPLKTVMAGAGPILKCINELIQDGKKLIVSDATNNTDIEQIILAINKSSYKILPAGTADTGKILAKIWLPEKKHVEEPEEIILPAIPRLIISGSATQINATQIEQLEKSYEYDNIDFIPLDAKIILNEISTDFVNDIISKLVNGNTVVIHSSKLVDNFDGFSDDSLKEELTKSKFAAKITDFLADLTKQITDNINVILVTLGGETSYKCCNKIESKELTMKDEVTQAIALCIDIKGQWIITKSGNLGNPNTLIDILKYIDKHESKI